MDMNKWPKVLPPLTVEQQTISNDFVEHWLSVLGNGSRQSFKWLENFNQTYVIKKTPNNNCFITTLEIGAGNGEHLHYETLSPEQKTNYVALDLRANMVQQIKINFPYIQSLEADCQETLPFADGHFDRILAIHVLEHLPNLPAAIKEAHRLCNKTNGYLSVVIPCEGGLAYSLARKLSAQKIFERRYQQSYDWFIKREHINLPNEIIEELTQYFDIIDRSYFPIPLAYVNLNICIGITLRPKALHSHAVVINNIQKQ
jgi:SAM-dependent methyltransferase